MDLRECNINETFFVILTDDLRLVFFSKFNKFVVKHILKELKIDSYIKHNNINNKIHLLFAFFIEINIWSISPSVKRLFELYLLFALQIHL